MAGPSYVRFFPSDWLGGTARMTRLHRSVYFDVCCYNWDKCAPVPPSELALIVMDVDNGSAVIAQLIAVGKLRKDEDGALYSPRAMEEALWSWEQWERRSKGGKAYKPSEHPSTTTKGKRDTLGKSEPTLIVSNNQNQNQNQNHIEELPTVVCRLSADVVRLVQVWNEVAIGPKARKPSPGMAEKIKQRLRQYGLADIEAKLRLIKRNNWVTDEWRPDLGKIMEARICEAMMNGRYDPKGAQPNPKNWTSMMSGL